MTASRKKTAEQEKAEAGREERIVEEREATDPLTEALEDSFPASDPPSVTQPRPPRSAPKDEKSGKK